MKTLPVNLCLEGKLAVVVGAGKVAARKAAALVSAGATVRVVGKRFAAEFEALEGIEAVRSAYARNHLEGAAVVIAATNSAAVNGRVARDARQLGAIVNVVDRPAISDFIFPAVAQKGDVAIAVSTGGASPMLAKRLKDEIANSLDDAYADLAWVLAALRSRAIKGIRSSARRRKFFEALADDRFLDIIRTRGRQHALAEAERFLEKEMSGTKERGGD